MEWMLGVKRRLSKSRVGLGFSLIEIMVATLLMALMGMLLMTSLNSSVSAKESVEQISQRHQVVRQALSRISREISMAYLSKHLDPLDPAYVTQFKGTKDRLYFSAFGNVVRQKDAKQSDQQVLAFYLGTDRLGQQSLIRRVHPNLNLDVEKGGAAQVLCPNVRALEFSYYNGRTEQWEESWISDPLEQVRGGGTNNSKSGEGKNSERSDNTPKSWTLPAFVKYTLTVEMGNGVEETWVGQTEIPIQEPLDLN